jgi:uncharacterized membrane protein
MIHLVIGLNVTVKTVGKFVIIIGFLMSMVWVPFGIIPMLFGTILLLYESGKKDSDLQK